MVKSKARNRRGDGRSLGVKTLADVGESGWLGRLAQSLVDDTRRVSIRTLVGFGDDAAVLALPGAAGRPLLFTTDVLIEGTHFTWRTATPATLGEKAVAVNVSDIAAMGGRPTAMIVGLGAPASFSIARLEALYRALERACRRWDIDLVGGDTVRSDRLILAPALLGEFDGPAERLPLRDRVRPGQYLYVTGTLGDSAAGLAILLATRGTRERDLAQPWRRRLVERHRRPQPRLAEGRALAGRLDDLAMIDLSDDLLKSVNALAQASGVGAAIRLDRLPMSPALRRFCRATRRDAVETAVCGGEDFELLFATAAPPPRVRRILANAGLTTPVRLIGRAGGKRVRWLDRDGRPVRIRPRAFEHFAGP